MHASGGSELNAVRTVELLARRGHEVVVLTLTSERTGMYERYRRAGVPVHDFPVNSMINGNAWRQVRRASRLMRESDADIVHSHDCYTNFLMGIAARMAGKASLVSKRWTEYPIPHLRYTDFVAFHLADTVLANSDRVGDTLTRHDRIPSRRIGVVTNFVDDDTFEPRDHRVRLREQFGFSSDEFVFVIVAQLRSEKNHSVLLQALTNLDSAGPPTRLLIVGDGPERNKLEDEVMRLQLSTRVIFAGHVERAWQVFYAADAAVLPSKHEGFPNSVIEAMATGTSVIASSVGGIPDAVTNGVTGLLVAPGDVASLTTAMRAIVADRQLRTTLSGNALARANEQYRSAVVIDRLEALYTRILEKRA